MTALISFYQEKSLEQMTHGKENLLELMIHMIGFVIS